MGRNANATQVEQPKGGGHVVWTTSMLSYMLELSASHSWSYLIFGSLES
jgi:hypothetical protein